MNTEYQGQMTDGENEQGCPYIGQTGTDAVIGGSDVLAALGFSSWEEMVAAAGLE